MQWPIPWNDGEPGVSNLEGAREGAAEETLPAAAEFSPAAHRVDQESKVDARDGLDIGSLGSSFSVDQQVSMQFICV